jgi:hypothetical protein
VADQQEASQSREVTQQKQALNQEVAASRQDEGEGAGEKRYQYSYYTL